MIECPSTVPYFLHDFINEKITFQELVQPDLHFDLGRFEQNIEYLCLPFFLMTTDSFPPNFPFTNDSPTTTEPFTTLQSHPQSH